MLSITIPLWMTITAAGLPTLCLTLLCVRLVRKKRHNAARKANPQRAAESNYLTGSVGFADQVHYQILEQQIDSVFNALATIIETERQKLKALTTPCFSMEGASAPISRFQPCATARPAESVADQGPADDQHGPEHADRPVSEQVAVLAGNGMTPEQIAQRLSLSVTEVSLAMKIQAGRANRLGSKMAAVA
jgi:hypothetical protein